MTPPLEVTPAELAEALQGPEEARPLLLDVRQPWEHERAALKDSLLIPLDELEERADELPPLEGRPLVVYCHLGVRSLVAVELLRQRGVPASSLRGGIDRWSLQVDPSVERY